MLAAAERRAQSIGLGADRVLICADAMTEEAYLAALATSLGTAYERLDFFVRADCPLNDAQLIHAAGAGLLPLRIKGRLVWIVAPRAQTARHLADRYHPAVRALRSFRLTSAERLWRFVNRHTQGALGRQAADGLRRARPLLSNGSRSRNGTGAAAAALLLLGLAGLTFAGSVALSAVSAVLSIIFLAAAGLRLSSALYRPPAPKRTRIDDIDLPIYTIICALYREERVVADLVAAIRALDYPGIMAQTPQAI